MVISREVGGGSGGLANLGAIWGVGLVRPPASLKGCSLETDMGEAWLQAALVVSGCGWLNWGGTGESIHLTFIGPPLRWLDIIWFTFYLRRKKQLLKYIFRGRGYRIPA